MGSGRKVSVEERKVKRTNPTAKDEEASLEIRAAAECQGDNNDVEPIDRDLGWAVKRSST